MTFSGQLLDNIRAFKRTLTWDLSDRAAVVHNLKFLYDCCVASEELLEEAAVMSVPAFDLRGYFYEHLEEERDEVPILANDLKSAGLDVTFCDPNPIAMAMIGTQYYLLKHRHPVSLLGYMMIQEADPTPIELVEKLEELHGKDLFKFLRLHAIKDREHAKELLEIINSLPAELYPYIKASTNNALMHLGYAMKVIYG